jgi:hypothetical protein
LCNSRKTAIGISQMSFGEQAIRIANWEMRIAFLSFCAAASASYGTYM